MSPSTITITFHINFSCSLSLSNVHFLSKKIVMTRITLLLAFSLICNYLVEGIQVREPENEEPISALSLSSPEHDQISEEVESHQPTGSSVSLLDGKQIEDSLSTIPTEFTFPENHKNFTQSLGSIEAPPPDYNQYQQQYETYYNQKNMYNSYSKPLKFDLDDNKVSEGLSANGEDTDTNSLFVPFRKPFPYLFDTNNGNQEVDAQFPDQQKPIPSLTTTESLNPLHENRDHHRDVAKKESPWKKILKVLTTIVPFGLLLATLTPNILYVNSTEELKPGRFRSLDHFENDDPLISIVKQYGEIDATNDPKCDDRMFCEMSRLGKQESSNFIERGFWYLANETPDDLANEIGMEELFKAIKNDNCKAYQCDVTKKDAEDKKSNKTYKSEQNELQSS